MSRPAHPTRPSAPSPASRSTADRGDRPHCNLAVVCGSLSSDPMARELPSGDVVHTYEVTVRSPDGPADTIPVARFGGRRPPALRAGDEVVVTGRVRRRFFRAGGATASRTEVVADAVIPARQQSRARAAVEQALGTMLDPS